MALHPEMVNLLEALEALQLPPLFSGPADAARERIRALVLGGQPPDTLTQVGQVTDSVVPGPAGDLPVRVYRPGGTGTFPTVMFFHGGGWVIGDLDTHDEPARRICHDVGAVVVSVDYRMAPEAPFPAPYEDCLAATRYVAAHLADFGGDPERVALAGDSAGGNLAAAVAVACRDAGLPVAAQLLIYPACDLAREYPSYEENAEGYFLTRDDTREAIARYTEGTADRTDPRISPLYTLTCPGSLQPSSPSPSTTPFATTGRPTPTRWRRPVPRWSCAGSPGSSTASSVSRPLRPPPMPPWASCAPTLPGCWRRARRKR